MDRLRLHTVPPPAAPRTRPTRLHLPVPLPDGTAGDAVGVPEEHGRSIMASLPRVGAVFGAGRHWWWVVPAESQVGLNWPATARYWPGACVPGPSVRETPGCVSRNAPRLLHWPEDATPYTHPLLLYIAVCRLAGVSPASSAGTGALPA